MKDKIERDLLAKILEGYRGYFKEIWKLFIDSGGHPATHNKFYEFMKDRISADITKLVGADVRERQNETTPRTL